MKRALFTLGVICLLVLMYSGLARADNIYYLTQDYSSGGSLGPWPSGDLGFGTVTVKPTSASSALVTVALDKGYSFANTGSAGHQQFLFNWDGNPAADMQVSGTLLDPPNFGSFGTGASGYFNVGLHISGIGSGGSTSNYNTISFTITDTADNDLLADFATGNGTALFAADILTPGGTGLVGAVPEPSTLALAVVGFAMLALLALFRRRIKLLA